MDYRTYEEKAGFTFAPLDTPLLGNIHMVMGMGTEVGELTDVFKKNLAYDKPIDWVNVREEIGDLMWYVANFCRINGIDMEEVWERNIAKLEARYGSSFNREGAINRNLDAERAILEQ